MYQIDDDAATTTTKSFYRQLHFNKAIKIHSQRKANTLLPLEQKKHSGICVHLVTRNAVVHGKRSYNEQKNLRIESQFAVTFNHFTWYHWFIRFPLFLNHCLCVSLLYGWMHSMTLKPQYIKQTFSMCMRANCICADASREMNTTKYIQTIEVCIEKRVKLVMVEKSRP